MKRHLELCIDLKDHRTAKDGLHQYRNLCQTVDPQSLEVVINHLVELSETQTAAAKMKANKVALAAAALISDLDQEETPESIMLSSMTEEGAKDRTDREVVVPWLKFIWETYRAVLELLHRNSKLEKVYHRICEKAFRFCIDYQRNLEFKRLCEMLRTHFINLQKLAQAPAKINRTSWEWTPEAVELHLQTRFSQLEVSVQLELWNEGFRTVADIHSIMQLAKKSTKPKSMSIYYEKLIRIFWVSENYLFHAYAWFRFYTLITNDSKRDLKPEDKTMFASCVLLSALVIPSLKDIANQDAMAEDEDDDVATEKNKELATVLDFGQVNPTRRALLQDIVAKGILKDVHPSLASLYDNMEIKFHPLKLAQTLCHTIASMKTLPQLAIYVLPIQKIAVYRVVQQISRVYSSVRIEFLKNLLSCLTDISYNTVEKIMIDGVSRKQLFLKLDHNAGLVKFGTIAAATAAIENQACQLGTQLSKIANGLDHLLTSGKSEEELSARKKYLRLVAMSENDDHMAIVNQQKVIESRKESLEQIQANRLAAEEVNKMNQMTQQLEQERVRLQMEEELRNKEKKKKLQEKQDVLKLQNALHTYGVLMEESALTELDVAARNTLLTEAKMNAVKEKEEETRRLTEQAKRLDHITRALRIEAAEVIKKKYAIQLVKDQEDHALKMVDIQSKLKEQHVLDLEEKARFSKMQNARSAFEATILTKQKEKFKVELEKLKKRAMREHREDKVARARALFEEELDAVRQQEEMEREQELKEERDRIEKEQHETLRRRREQEEEAERLREAEDDRRRVERGHMYSDRQQGRDLGKDVERQPQDERVSSDEPSWKRERAPLPPMPAPRAAAADEPSNWRGGARPPAANIDRETPRKSAADEVDRWRGSARKEDGTTAASGGSGLDRLEQKWAGGSRGGNADGEQPRWSSRSAAPPADGSAAPAPRRNLDEWAKNGGSNTDKKPREELPARRQGGW